MKPKKGTKEYADWLLNTEEGREVFKNTIAKVTQERRELEQAFRHHKDLKRLKYLLTNVQNIVHEYVRLRDKDKPCISCGQPLDDSLQAGHFYAAKDYSALKFDEDNIHGQCVGCNIRSEGNLNKYDLNLPKRIGQHKYSELKSKALRSDVNSLIWHPNDLELIRKEYKKKLKKIKDGIK